MTVIWQPIFKGHRKVEGYYFSSLLLSEHRMRQRIHQLWSARCRLYRAFEGYVLKCGEPHWVNTGLALGLPFVETSGVFATAPLGKREIAQMGCFREDWILVIGGCGRRLKLDADHEADPCIWLNLTNYPLVEMKPLCLPPKLVMEHPKEVAGEALAGVIPDRQDEAINQLLNSLNKTKDPAEIEGAPLSGLRKGIWNILKRLQRPKSQKSDGQTQGQTKDGTNQSKTSRAKFPFLGSLLNKLGATLLFRRQHAQFIRKMIGLFEDGNLDQALRYAIPLRGDEQSQASPQLGFFKPRVGLILGSGANGSSGGSLFLEGGFYQFLQDHYQRAFDRLNAAGQFEKAAYVLESLLNQPERAVLYLEEKGKLVKAAQVAQGRNLPPGWVVRLLFQIGDRQAALLWARRTGAFFQCLKMLEKRDPQQAVAWRVLWARNLARSGDYGAAVDVAWPVPELHRVAATWIDFALQEGGEAGTRLLAKSLHLKTNDLTDTLLRIKALFSQDGDFGPRRRRVFADSLLELNASQEVRWVAHGLMRPLLKDYARGFLSEPWPLFKKLNLLAGSSAMTPELKVLGQKLRPSRKGGPQLGPGPRKCFLEEKGAAPIYDCVWGPGGRLVIALGEAGFSYISRQGKLIYHGETPAYRWVSSDLGNRLLTFAQRDGWLDLNSIDLHQRKVWPLGMIPKDCAAADFDGSHWYLTLNHSLTALDAHEKKLVEIWRVPDLPGKVLSIARNATRLHMLVENSDATWEQWAYELPSHRLLQRQLIPWDRQLPVAWNLQPNGLFTVVVRNTESYPPADPSVDPSPNVELATYQMGIFKQKGSLEDVVFTHVSAYGDMVLLREKTQTGGILHLLGATGLKTFAKIQFNGEVRARFTSEGLLIATQAGCVYRVDTRSFELRCLLRT